MDSKAEGLRQSMLEKQRQKIYEESEKERQKNAKVTLGAELFVF
jgi:protein FAM50